MRCAKSGCTSETVGYGNYCDQHRPVLSVHMVDQSDRHDVRPDSNAAKLARAREYLTSRNIEAIAKGNELRYTPAVKGSRVLRHLLKRAA